MKEFSWNLFEKLSQKYGDFFYLLDLKKFESNYSDFLEAFRAIYPNTNIAYSYKTNYIPRLCELVNSLGGYAEVVSRMEYELAVRIGVSPSKIIFNGPLKFHEDIEIALLSGSIVNLDSLSEVAIVKNIADKMPEVNFAVGIRCNFDIGVGTVSRFGFDTDGEELQEALKTLNSIVNCSIVGLHCHFSAPQRNIESYALRTQKMLYIYAKYFRQNHLRFIDIGGGFCGRMSEELQTQLDYYCPTYKEYAEIIAAQFANEFPSVSGPQLILEPGVAITGDVMKFVCSVVGTKTIRLKNFIQTTGSIYNIKPTLHKKNLPVRVYSPQSSKTEIPKEYDIVGFTCMEHDYLFRGFRGAVLQGDYIVFDNVGAYTNVLVPPFIRPAPPIVSVDIDSGSDELVKGKETFDNVFSTYKMN